MKFRAAGLSDTGLAREHNEDCFGIDGASRLFVVADGMGGHSFGEVASRISIDSIVDFMKSDSADGSVDGQELQPQSRRLKTAIERAQDDVLGAIEQDESLRGMGTTVVGLLLDGETGTLAHVGDSRLYRLRGEEFEQMTEDHTWVNEQVMAGYLTAEQARTHPLRNVVTRALGGEANVQVEVTEVPVQEGDIFLLCSDGLTGMLRDSEIQDLLENGEDLDQTCQSLVDAANDRGGGDNITVVLVSVERDGA